MREAAIGEDKRAGEAEQHDVGGRSARAGHRAVGPSRRWSTAAPAGRAGVGPWRRPWGSCGWGAGEEGHAVGEMRVMAIVALHRRKRGVVVEVEEFVSIASGMADHARDCCGCRWPCRCLHLVENGFGSMQVFLPISACAPCASPLDVHGDACAACERFKAFDDA
jgi:hypothetical protein